VTIEATSPPPAEAARCESLVDALPNTISSQDRRMVSPAAALGAAWGDPAIVLTCGGSWELPEAINCQEVDGVDWWAPESQIADQSADVVLTTVGYSPAIRVMVPASYRPPTAVMGDLAPAIKATLEHPQPCR